MSKVSRESVLARLREVVQQASRADRFDQLSHVEPLIKALYESLQMHAGDEAEARELMSTLRLVPIYSPDPLLGSEPLATRWVVAKPERFHQEIERLRARFPERSEFKR